MSIAAEGIANECTLLESDTDPPPGAVSTTVELYGSSELEGVDAFRLELSYDPSDLPPGASPTDVGIAVVTHDGIDVLESDVDLEDTTVSAVETGLPRGERVVAVATSDPENRHQRLRGEEPDDA